jgi:hypothetical protein
MKKTIKLLKIHWKRVVTVLLVALIFTLQVYKFRFGTDLIFVTLLIAATLHSKPFKFLVDWIPPIILFYVYEYVRGRANLVADKLGIETAVESIVNLERKIFFMFNEIPPVVIQQWLKPDLHTTYWYDYILFFFYTSFFWFWLASGYVVWIYKRDYFKRYIYGFMSYALSTAIWFIFFPAAPPWYASNEGYIPYVERVLWTDGGALPSDGLEFVSTYGGNPVAAVPSNHAGWPFFASVWLILLFGWKKAGWTIIFPFMIAFSTWFGAEHYVIDSLFGFAFAGLFVFLSWKWKEVKSFIKKLNPFKKF